MARKLRAQPGLKFVARRGDPWGAAFLSRLSFHVRSLGSFALARSAPVVEVDAKVGGVLSREKGVSAACLAALPVLPVIPNFLARAQTLPAPENDAPGSSLVRLLRPTALFASVHAGSVIRGIRDSQEEEGRGGLGSERGQTRRGVFVFVRVRQTRRRVHERTMDRRLRLNGCAWNH